MPLLIAALHFALVDGLVLVLLLLRDGRVLVDVEVLVELLQEEAVLLQLSEHLCRARP